MQKKLLSSLTTGLVLTSFVLNTTAFASPTQTQIKSVSQEKQTQAVNPTQQLSQNNEGFIITPLHKYNNNTHKFIFEIKPGDTITDSVVIKNLGNKTSTFLLYAANPTLSNQGTLAFKTRDNMGDGPANWFIFSEPSVELAPNESKVVNFEVKIPENTEEKYYTEGVALEKVKKDVNNPSILIATRIIVQANIKVTKTPQAINQQTNETVTIQEQNTGWPIYYFWFSLIAFIISLALLTGSIIYERIKQNNQPKDPEITEDNEEEPTKNNETTIKQSTKPETKKAQARTTSTIKNTKPSNSKQKTEKSKKDSTKPLKKTSSKQTSSRTIKGTKTSKINKKSNPKN